MRIAVISGSTRPGRRSAAVAHWVTEQAHGHDQAEFTLVDVADYDLSLLGEATVPGAANRVYENPQTRAWSQVIDSFDGFIFVTPEYNHSVPAALKNAFDLLYPEWGNKTIAFVGYGASGALRAVEHWRAIIANAYMYATRAQVAINVFTDFPSGQFTPTEQQAADLHNTLDELVALTSKLGSPALAI